MYWPVNTYWQWCWWGIIKLQAGNQSWRLGTTELLDTEFTGIGISRLWVKCSKIHTHPVLAFLAGCSLTALCAVEGKDAPIPNFSLPNSHRGNSIISIIVGKHTGGWKMLLRNEHGKQFVVFMSKSVRQWYSLNWKLCFPAKEKGSLSFLPCKVRRGG